MKNKLPNFLIVGAAKSGTSSLHNYLNQHPEVFMPSYSDTGMKVKEPRFFIKDIIQKRVHNGIWNWQEYQSLFSGVKDEKAIGESTVLYLYYYDYAIKNIKEYLGENIKIIIMLRNPVQRAYSAFQHVSRGVKENYSFEKALDIEEGRINRDLNLTPMVMYKDMGMYYNMVKSYLDAFSDVHVIIYDDFRDNTRLEVEKTFQFLEVDNDFSVDVSMRHNVGGRQWRSKGMKYFFMNENKLINFFKIFMKKEHSKFIRDKLIKLSTSQINPINLETEKELKKFFFNDVENLSKLINRDLTHWIL